MAVENCNSIDVGLFLRPNGEIKTCCSGEKDLGNIKINTIDEIFDNDIYIQIKKDQKQNILPAYCNMCEIKERMVPESSLFNEYARYTSNGTRKLKHIDVRWHNTCNLTCRYCNPIDSSKWQQLLGMPLENTKRSYYQSVLEKIESNRDTIEKVFILGGEPLLLNENEQLLEIIKKETEICVISNLSVKLENNKIFKLLEEMPNVSWFISFDNVADRFEYVRYGAKWDTLIHNLDILQNQVKPLAICAHAVYGIFNATRLEEWYDFLNSMNLNVDYQLANNQGENGTLSIFDHDPRIKQLAIDEIKKLKNPNRFLSNAQTTLLNSLNNDFNKNISKNFLNWIENNEKLLPPKDNFSQLWPELYEILIDK
jgi:MoaA/NifB/PqqE/SkfB family radical SAM enzyme